MTDAGWLPKARQLLTIPPRALKVADQDDLATRIVDMDRGRLTSWPGSYTVYLEKKAAALPPKLTVPMILFFLPVLFAVIIGPAAIQVMQAQAQSQ